MCKRGDFVDCVVQGRKQKIDRCIAPIVNALNDAGIITVESCCGHGETEGHILAYQDGMARLFVIYEIGRVSTDKFREHYRKLAEESEEKTKKIIGGKK